MPVKAKFRCLSVTDTGNQKQAVLSAVSGNKDDNYDYAKYTPSGNMNITVDKGTKAADFFQPQRDYYLTFEDAPVIEEGTDEPYPTTAD